MGVAEGRREPVGTPDLWNGESGATLCPWRAADRCSRTVQGSLKGDLVSQEPVPCSSTLRARPRAAIWGPERVAGIQRGTERPLERSLPKVSR